MDFTQGGKSAYNYTDDIDRFTGQELNFYKEGHWLEGTVVSNLNNVFVVDYCGIRYVVRKSNMHVVESLSMEGAIMS